LSRNQIGDDGITALAQAIKPVSEGGSGAMANCQSLNLVLNKIGDAGMEAFASACARGAMGKCTDLALSYNQIGDAGITALAQAITPVSEGGSGALPQCMYFSFHSNQIGDAGITALAQAITPVSEGGSGHCYPSRSLSWIMVLWELIIQR
jgi:hypothetical protein